MPRGRVSATSFDRRSARSVCIAALWLDQGGPESRNSGYWAAGKRSVRPSRDRSSVRALNAGATLSHGRTETRYRTLCPGAGALASFQSPGPGWGRGNRRLGPGNRNKLAGFRRPAGSGRPRVLNGVPGNEGTRGPGGTRAFRLIGGIAGFLPDPGTEQTRRRSFPLEPLRTG